MPLAAKHSTDFSAPPQYMRVGANEIAYYIIGNGSPLVFITGWPFNSTTYRNLLPQLSEHFQCVLLDSPGLGLTRWSVETDFTFPGQAKTFGEFIDSLDIESYYLIAHNTGATIARLMAAEHGSRVRGFVILNTEIPYERPPWFPLYARLMRIPGSGFFFRMFLRSQVFLKSPMGFGGCYSDKSLINEAFKKAYVQPLIDDPCRLEGAMRYLSIGLDFHLIDHLSQIHARIQSPVTLVWGQLDPTFPISGARRMMSEFGNVAELVAVENGKLLAHEEFPEQVATAVLSAFGQNR